STAPCNIGIGELARGGRGSGRMRVGSEPDPVPPATIRTMKLIHSPLHALHDGGMELHRGELVPCFEMPARVDHILAAVARAGWAVQPPREYDDAVLASVHDAQYLAFLRGAHAEWQ